MLDYNWSYGNGTYSKIRQIRLHDFASHRTSIAEIFGSGVPHYFESLGNSHFEHTIDQVVAGTRMASNCSAIHKSTMA